MHFVAGAVQDPVLMKATRAAAAAMQAFRLTLVRRSSSMMPILMVWRGSRQVLDAVEQLVGEGGSAGPCILGLTM